MGKMSSRGSRYAHQVTGVSLPGVPLVVAGSNGKIAWGYTNSYGDFSDVIVLEQERPGSYLTAARRSAPGNGLRNHRRQRRASAAGGIEKTIWGPVPRAARMVESSCSNGWPMTSRRPSISAFLAWRRTENVADAIGVANRARLPSQNILLVDSGGNLAWTIIGAIPKRVGCDGDEPVSFADGSCSWQGYLAADEYPLLMNPA
jgi:penicillin amidase